MAAELPERALEQQYPGTAPEADAAAEEQVLAVLPTNFPATRISQEQFTKALVNLVKDMPLPVKDASRPLPGPGRGIVLTSGSATGAAWRSPLAQGYGRFCAQRGTPGDCLNRFEDDPELDDDDKRAIALDNTENVIKVEAEVHTKISAYYSSKQADTGFMVVREWLRTQSYEQQRAYGLKVLRDFGVIP